MYYSGVRSQNERTSNIAQGYIEECRYYLILAKDFTALKINLYHFHPSDGEAKLHGRLNSEYLNSLGG